MQKVSRQFVQLRLIMELRIRQFRVCAILSHSIFHGIYGLTTPTGFSVIIANCGEICCNCGLAFRVGAANSTAAVTTPDIARAIAVLPGPIVPWTPRPLCYTQACNPLILSGVLEAAYKKGICGVFVVPRAWEQGVVERSRWNRLIPLMMQKRLASKIARNEK